MTEYIERERALDAISDWLMKAAHSENISSYNDGERAAYRTAMSEIANLPAADVRPVVKARWITKPYMMGNTQYCSRCGENYGREHNYCPNCGADMRGEQDV